MNPYSKPNELKVGAKRPKIVHLAPELEKRTQAERRAEKTAVTAERRAIKKAARRHLRRALEREVEEIE